MNIDEILARRTDLSTFLVHLTREKDGSSPVDALLGILREQRIEARSPLGMAAKALEGAGHDTASQNAVCFTETPLENVNLLTEHIDGRTCQFAPYGVAISRKQGRREGVNPVWYLDITPGHDWLTNPVNNLVREAVKTGDFDRQDIATLTPLIEQMGTHAAESGEEGTSYKKEFWWEREWRHVGDFRLPNRYIVLCPSEDICAVEAAVEELDEFERPQKVSYVDPRWSLEMIIGKLAGLSGSDLGAF